MTAIIDDTYAEAFKACMEILITATNKKWLDMQLTPQPVMHQAVFCVIVRQDSTDMLAQVVMKVFRLLMEDLFANTTTYSKILKTPKIRESCIS